MHEISNLVLWGKNKKSISVYRLLKILSRVLSIEGK